MIDYEKLQKNSLFKDMDIKEIKKYTSLFKITSHQKSSIIFFEKDIINKFFIVLEGKVSISKYDLEGNKKIIAFISEYEIFGETIALSNFKSPYTVECVENTKLLNIDVNIFKKLTIQSANLFNNVIDVLSTKNAFLTFKIDILSKRTIKERLYELFHYYYINTNSYIIKLPYNRSQLSDFLAINRSALTRELAKLEEEGFFEYKNKKYYLNEEMFHFKRE